MEKLDWIERAAIENLTRRVQNADAIHKEANTLLALLLSGGGAALYFAAKETAHRAPSHADKISRIQKDSANGGGHKKSRKYISRPR
jgi:hypothetical protein